MDLSDLNNYGYVIYMHASMYLLKRLDGVYNAALHFITNACSLIHPCLVYNWRVLFISKKEITYVIYCKGRVCFQITLLVVYAYIERNIAPDHQVELN